MFTGSAKFMPTHILTWFITNKNENSRKNENWKFIAAAYSQITCNSIQFSFIPIWPLYLIICFSLPSKALHDAHRTSLGDQGSFPLQFGLQILERITRSPAGFALEDGPDRIVERSQDRAPWGPVFLADERRDVGLNPPLSLSWAI